MRGKKNNSIKNLINAHSWLGVIISVALFIVFWAGSIVLFHPELVYWAQAPLYKTDTHGEKLPLQQVIDLKLAEHQLNNEEHLTVLMAGEHRPFHHIYIDQKPQDGYEGPEQVAMLVVDPKTGETLANIEDFYLADFLLHLHYDLRLPGGFYLVGVVTLIFLVLIFTGIYIHARKLVTHFFLYREKSRRNKLLDTHNLVGVMSLPFGLMYAITGLIFNLSIIYQIAIAVFLYDGSRDTLLSDSGYTIISEKPRGTPLDMTPAYDQLEKVERELGEPVEMLRFYNYGDENAVMQLYAHDSEHFARHYEEFYRVRDGSLISHTNTESENAVRRGLDVISTLHFGSFAGLNLRILYFLMGIAIAGMILAGNLLWLDKRVLQKNANTRSIHFVASLTLGGCCGVVVATAIAFLAERVMPLDLAARGNCLAALFATTLGLSVILAFTIPNKRQFLRACLWATSALLSLTVVSDWVLLDMDALWKAGYRAVFGVEISLLLTAGLSLWITRILGQSAIQTEKIAPVDAEPQRN